MDTKKSVMLAIDGNSLINREYYGMPQLSSSGGLHTNAVLGFVNKLIRYTAAFSPDFAAAAFDLPEPTFRHLRYPGYKASRKGMPEELAEQLPYVKEACRIFGFAVAEEAGWEADDILGTIAEKAENIEDGDTAAYIITGDRDCFQLISDGVFVLYNSNAELTKYDPQKIREQYGLEPRQLIDVKALMGDPSDEIPGVAGIGEKGALRLIAENGSLEALYKNLDAGALKLLPAAKKKLLEGREDAFLSRELAEICRSAPLKPEVFQKRREPDRGRLYDFCKSLELFSVIKKLSLSPADEQLQFEF
ncbi:MAG: hypothetical protein FWD23_06280 [Oscillospiraceae bacterium]|nr:hypothetical protein [Oscillospiraceae bacterium]